MVTGYVAVALFYLLSWWFVRRGSVWPALLTFGAGSLMLATTPIGPTVTGVVQAGTGAVDAVVGGVITGLGQLGG